MAPSPIRSAGLRRLLLGLVLIGLALSGCNEPEPQDLRPVTSEADHQVKRLREDTELELEDLRGRWLATEGLLTHQRQDLRALQESSLLRDKTLKERVLTLELAVDRLGADLETIRQGMTAPPTQASALDRLARSYEEIDCLRRRGAEESVASVYKRYGFKDADAWAEAWMNAARDEAFERAVTARVERLCP